MPELSSASAAPTVSMLQVRLLQAFAERVGVPIDPVLERLELTPSVLPHPEQRLAAERYVKLLVETDRLCDRGGFWFEFGREYTLPTHGDLGQAIQSCRSPREALPLVCRYHPTIGAGLQMRCELGREGVLQLAAPNPGDEQETRVRSELLLAIVKSGLERLLGEPVSTLRFEFNYAAPANAALYRHHLGPHVAFARPATRMLVPQALMDRPFGNADPLIRQLYVQRCEERLDQVLREADVVTRVAQVLAALVPASPTLAEVAAQLATTPRTLTRRLAEHGSSFRQLQQRLRHQRAQAYLAGGQLSIKEIAARLGFDSSSNFSRAFTAFSGVSPMAFRNQKRPPSSP